jgi:hypothetical protein
VKFLLQMVKLLTRFGSVSEGVLGYCMAHNQPSGACPGIVKQSMVAMPLAQKPSFRRCSVIQVSALKGRVYIQVQFER